jgi:glycosyltransferase involved in cell wall biosynthesis
MPTSSNRPLVSVVMSVYNGARFLDQAINSIRAQTYRHFEFLVVDDGSKDATPETLSRHAAEDPRIRVISQENRGLIESLHRGFAAATGTYVARMDADDFAKPERLEMQVDFLTSNPGIALVGGAVEVIDGESRVLNTIRLPSDPERVRLHMRKLGCALAHPTVLFRRSVLEKVGGFRKAYLHAEDYDLWLRMLESFELANLDHVLLGYRRHEASISYRHARQQALSALCARTTAQLRLLGCPDPTSEVDLVTDAVIRDLGVKQNSIDEAIFTSLLAATEDAMQCGVSSAAADFFRFARSYAPADRLRHTSLDLNRKAMDTPSTLSEKRKHRTRLLAADPDTYWALFGVGNRSPEGQNGLTQRPASRSERHDGVEMHRPTLSDILRQNRYDTDKSHEYLRDYERACCHLRDAPIALLEVGVNKGGSLLLWRDYFTRGEIFGIDLFPPADLSDSSGRIRVFRGDQGNSSEIDAVASRASPSGFHIIIDDASHIGALTAATFKTLFYKHLKPGGFYAIEDWGTGYWESWPDGSRPAHDALHFENQGNQFPSHQSGMVGFVKQLVDETALPDILHPRFGVPGNRRSYIRSIHLSTGLAIIEKSLD